jgi:hypothetical protein
LEGSPAVTTREEVSDVECRRRDLIARGVGGVRERVEHRVASSDPAFEVDEAKHSPGEVTLVVRDFGRWRAEEFSEARGRGLQMIELLMTDLDVVRSGRGTEIVMRRRLD